MRIPWLTFPCIGLLEKTIGAGSRVFEYGGGGSTLFFLDRGATVVTAEHDPEWFVLLQGRIGHGDVAGRWTGLLREPTPAPGAAAAAESDAGFRRSDPGSYISGDERYEGLWFRDYVGAIDAYADGHFDLVLIDGRARPSCIKHAAAKVEAAGLLVLDNSERDYYLSAAQEHLAGYRTVLDGFGPAPGVGWFTKTTAWQRSG
jgi:hypothetical protein